jgi:hypothetical protein
MLLVLCCDLWRVVVCVKVERRKVMDEQDEATVGTTEPYQYRAPPFAKRTGRSRNGPAMGLPRL